MSLFIAAAAVLAFIVVVYVLWPLLRSAPRSGSGVSSDQANLAIHRAALQELEADLAAGSLEPEAYEQARLDIERRLLEDVRNARSPAAQRRIGPALALGLAVPVCAVLVYLVVGTPQAIVGAEAPAVGPHATDDAQLLAQVTRLAARLESAPDDVEGWVTLARSYAALERFSEASAAYARASKILPEDAQLLADHADVLGMTQGRSLAGEPERLVKRALAIDPGNVKALALAGTAAFQRQDYASAVKLWERILPLVGADGRFVASVRESIAEARSLGGLAGRPPGKADAPVAKAPTARVSGTARLAAGLTAKAGPDDAVFIFARAAEGPRVPLAVLRKKVRDLPVEFTLDDSLAMSPEFRLSAFKRVVIGARISKAGTAAARPGDLQGLSAPVELGAQRVNVVIDTELE